MVSKKDDASTARVPVSETYLALSGASERAAALRENLGGDRIEPSDLTRIKMPAGGGTTWMIPSLGGDAPATAIEGIVLDIHPRRAYWMSAAIQGTPPDCASSDGRVGVGTPGGECGRCPLNVYGSARKPDGTAGRGKACKESRLLFILRPSEVLPDVLIVPPGSLRSLRSFLLQLPKPKTHYVLSIGLVQATSKGGIKYAQLAPKVSRELSPEDVEQVNAYAKSLAAVLGATTIDAADMAD